MFNTVVIDLSPAVDVLNAVSEAALKSPALMKNAARLVADRSRRRVLARIKVVPGKPHYPLRWKSDKQRRYVMMMLRAQGNLPYQRTNDMINRWEVVHDFHAVNSFIEMRNDSPYVGYVQGDDAQPFHLDTGWVQAAQVAADERPIVENAMIEMWFTIADPFAGVT